ncbi:MAG TPA: Spy/CpxP family protein refolding chaperone [Planctomycetaceae bacterium]|jgi:Spy/CpxP family protein refolding chaperone
MRNFSLSWLVVVMVCLVASDSAFAQNQGRRGRGGAGGGGGFGMMGSLQLLGIPQVQKELKLSDDQIAKIKVIADANQPAGGRRGGGQQATDEERAERRKKAEEAGNQAVALLNDEQATRFKQVRIWVEGTRALTSDETVAKQLNLTDDQKGALKTIADEAAKKQREQFAQGGRGQNVTDEERAKRREQMATLAKETETESLAVLTDDQKSQFQKLRGPKFELDRSALGGGRGGRRGRAGANNN